ncbi:MAG TPA: hypothetical protein VLF18_18815 [Tahibacter sp.]|uniref:hypothetical protein n=1 Tax=Tahibacter sp. TaxID=2056211 RepID=UPI002C09450B|nr:hypothetical protein [Tahibacter sp.]HSX62240.1 hypothetical protein [Tahibacter sp.]
MRAKLMPRRRGERVYATWSPADRHGSIGLSSGNLLASGVVSSWQGIRATLPIASDQHYWETLYTFGGATDVAAGIELLTAPLNVRLGSTSGQTAGPDKLGDFWRDGIKILDLASLTTGVVIRHWLDADAGVYRIAIGSGAWQTVTANPSNTYAVWYPAAALFGNASVTANFGQLGFMYAVPPGVRAGVYTVPVETISLYVSSHAVNTAIGDDPPEQPYQARIAADSDVDIEREGSCWVWGGQTRSSRGELTLVLDRAVSWWRDLLWRDATVVIDRGFRTPAGDTWSEWTRCRVEKANDGMPQRLVLTLTDELARLDRPMQDELYPETIGNPQMIHRAKPVALGRPQYVEGAQLSVVTTGPTAYTYDLHDRALFSIDAIFDKGQVHSYPADWQYMPARTGFQLTFAPDGKTTCHPRGAMRRIETLIDDSNGGTFGDWVSGSYDDDPLGWVVSGEGGPNNRVGPGVGDALQFVSTVLEVTIGKGVLVEGEWYELHVDVVDVTDGALYAGSDVDRPVLIDQVGAYVYTFQADVGSTQFVLGGTACDVTIRSVALYHVRLIEYLPDWLHYLFVTRGGIDFDSIDWTSIDALNAATHRPRRLAHFGTPNIQALVRLTLDGWTGSAFAKRSGLVSVGRLEPPTGNATIRLGKHNLISPPRRVYDEARGFTTRLAGKRNYTPHSDSDIYSTATPAEIAELKAVFLIERSGLPASVSLATSTAVVDEQRKYADGAEPKETLLQESADIQAEASRAVSLCRGSPDFFECDAILSASEADDAEPFQEVFLQWDDIEELQAGRYGRARRVRSSFWANVVRLLVWFPDEDST